MRLSRHVSVQAQSNITRREIFFGHESSIFSQGLILKDQDTFIESTGLYGESVIHYVDRKTLKVGLETELGSEFFGEGCELVNLNGEQLIYQLTWRERKVYRDRIL